ncbi:Arm DNA-binding domain-containing protein [Hufsiella ginkgonis]|uniref:Arm DNA-binding domain-containing protein n=1 Tax=Hufsiella ginkgonis TaxID=2695274 RepID=A0A7K1XTJ0_9SPHI|nr:hypothetical protein [Hufsiella ginkgonis]
MTVNGRRIEVSLKQSIQESDWNAVKGVAKGSRKEIVALNNYLERHRASVVSCYQELSLQKKLITVELIKEM